MEKKQVVVVKGLIVFNRKALIVKRSPKSKVAGGEWELVGGKLHVGEELEETLIREAEEETGLKINPQKILYASVINDDPKRQLIFLHYLCKTENDSVVLSEEHTAFYWADQRDLKKMLRTSVLRDFEQHHIFELEDLK